MDILDDFVLGTKDVSSIFVLPTETIGRDGEQIRSSTLYANLSGAEATSDMSTVHSKRLHSTAHHSDSLAFSNDSKTPSSRSSSASITSVDMASSRASHSYSSNGDSRRNYRQDRTEVIVIRGYPGIGKTIFVTSLRAPLRKYGYFAHFAVRLKSRRPFEAPIEILSHLDGAAQRYNAARMSRTAVWTCPVGSEAAIRWDEAAIQYNTAALQYCRIYKDPLLAKLYIGESCVINCIILSTRLYRTRITLDQLLSILLLY
ncbi:hypothetical protein V1508DRAFT_271202 [Lipomyces doorenjongii]|uniref:uncharacterized protein n=1 Tax=Lipomyces doorenjongii TaxID=383834 RepID=UPI0034CE6361